MPARLPTHESVEVPDPRTEVGAVLHVRFVELVDTDRVMFPAKPFSDPTLIVEVRVAPRLTVTLVGVAVIVKS